MPERRPRLEGKGAIVTGAGSSGPGIGNGRATSVLFAREDAKVLLVDAVIERAEETLAMIREEGGEALVVRANVVSADDCLGMVGPPSSAMDISISWTTTWAFRDGVR